MQTIPHFLDLHSIVGITLVRTSPALLRGLRHASTIQHGNQDGSSQDGHLLLENTAIAINPSFLNRPLELDIPSSTSFSCRRRNASVHRPRTIIAPVLQVPSLGRFAFCTKRRLQSGLPGCPNSPSQGHHQRHRSNPPGSIHPFH